MNTDPAFHPQTPELLSDTAQNSPDGTGVPESQVKGGVIRVHDVPCSPDFDPAEDRSYAGVGAAILATAVMALLKLRLRKGFGAMLHVLLKLPAQVEHGIYIYTRVKAAMKKLAEPIALNVRVNEDGTYVPRFQVRLEDTREKISETVDAPRQDWAALEKAKGYDVRGTSLAWVEHRVSHMRAKARRVAKREFYVAEGLTSAKPTQRQQSDMEYIRRKRRAAHLAYEAYQARRTDDVMEYQDAAPEVLPVTYYEIWPPVPAPILDDVTVSVQAVPAKDPAPTLEEIEPLIGVDYNYGNYTVRHSYKAGFGHVLAVGVPTDPEKPP